MEKLELVILRAAASSGESLSVFNLNKLAWQNLWTPGGKTLFSPAQIKSKILHLLSIGKLVSNEKDQLSLALRK